MFSADRNVDGLFEHKTKTVYSYRETEELETGDLCATNFARNHPPLPSAGGSLSGEALEFLDGGKYEGLVIETTRKGWFLSNRDLNFHPMFEDVELFLGSNYMETLHEDLALALDLALFREDDVVYSNLYNLFKELQSFLDREFEELNNVRDDSEEAESYYRDRICDIKRGNSTTFRAKFPRINRTMAKLHQQKFSIYEEFVELLRENSDRLADLTAGFPESDENLSENEELKNFYHALREDLGKQRENLSPLTDFSPSRAERGLVVPLYDEDNPTLSQTIAVIKQIVDNFLYRGIFLSKRYEKLLEPVFDSLDNAYELYDKLTFPRQEPDFLFSHLINVWLLSGFTARDLELSSSKIRSLGVASLFFDLGMLSVPLNAWTGPDQPSDEEVDQIKRHPLKSARWLNESYHEFGDSVRSIVKRHHERLDGSGYPLKAKEEELTQEEKILLCIDVYEAMSTSRPHRDAISTDKLTTYLRNRLMKFDKTVVDSLERNFGPYPPGTIVQLNTNEIGVVVPNQSNPSTPRVKIMIDSSGTVQEDPESIELDDQTSKRIIDTLGKRKTPTALIKFLSR